MVTEYCIWFPPMDIYYNNEFVGTRPGFYEIVKGKKERDEAVRMGGRDYSNSDRAWEDAEAGFRAECESYL